MAKSTPPEQLAAARHLLGMTVISTRGSRDSSSARNCLQAGCEEVDTRVMKNVTMFTGDNL